MTLPPADPALPDSTAAWPQRIGIVRNPRSHRNKRLARPPVETDRILIAAPPSREGLAAELARLAAHQVDLIVVDGGDGTVRDTLTQGAAVFGNAWPRLMVVPKGKTNALALDLDMPRRITLEEAIAGAAQGTVKRRHALRIEPLDHPAPPVFGFIMGTGVFNAAIDAAQVTHRLGAFQGFAVGLTVVSAITGALLGIGKGPWRALWPTRICAQDGAELPHSRHGRDGQRWVAGFTTLTGFPLGMEPFAGMGGGEPPTIACIAVDAPLRRVVARAPLILAGAHGPHYTALGVHHVEASSFTAELGSRFILDGEAFPPGAYRIALGPALDFVVP